MMNIATLSTNLLSLVQLSGNGAGGEGGRALTLILIILGILIVTVFFPRQPVQALPVEQDPRCLW